MEQINFGLFFSHLAVYLLVWVFAITAQSAATAWMANYYGDPTAKNQGRISFSPFVQADLVGTIILPIISFALGWMSPGTPFIAWGKPVPIDSENFSKPKAAGAMVTLAAIFASTLIAFGAFILIKILFLTNGVEVREFLNVALAKNNTTEFSWLAPIQLMLWYSLVVNVVMVIFSLLPIPPFSGGVVLFSFLPESLKPLKDFFNKFGLIIGLVLVYFVIVRYVMIPVIQFILKLLII